MTRPKRRGGARARLVALIGPPPSVDQVRADMAVWASRPLTTVCPVPLPPQLRLVNPPLPDTADGQACHPGRLLSFLDGLQRAVWPVNRFIVPARMAGVGTGVGLGVTGSMRPHRGRTDVWPSQQVEDGGGEGRSSRAAKEEVVQLMEGQPLPNTSMSSPSPPPAPSPLPPPPPPPPPSLHQLTPFIPFLPLIATLPAITSLSELRQNRSPGVHPPLSSPTSSCLHVLGSVIQPPTARIRTFAPKSKPRGETGVGKRVMTMVILEFSIIDHPAESTPTPVTFWFNLHTCRTVLPALPNQQQPRAGRIGDFSAETLAAVLNLVVGDVVLLANMISSTFQGSTTLQSARVRPEPKSWLDTPQDRNRHSRVMVLSVYPKPFPSSSQAKQILSDYQIYFQSEPFQQLLSRLETLKAWTVENCYPCSSIPDGFVPSSQGMLHMAGDARVRQAGYCRRVRKLREAILRRESDVSLESNRAILVFGNTIQGLPPDSQVG